MARFIWRGADVMLEIDKATIRGMERACRFVCRKLRETISKPSPPASRPGEPPHRRSGKLSRAIRWSVSRVSRTGTIWLQGAKYGYWLDSGTRSILPRPWILVTVMRHYRTIGRLFAGGKS